MSEDQKESTQGVEELSKSELVNEIVDQETGEVKQGQPGGSSEGVTDRPPLSEQDARRVNGYAGYENIAEQRKDDPTKADTDNYDVVREKTS